MVKVLFDHNMPPRIARALHALIEIDGHAAVALRDMFPPNTSDVDLYTALGREPGWIVISKDEAQAKRAPERRAILSSGVVAYYLSPKLRKLSVNQQAATIIWQWDKIVQHSRQNRNGLFRIPENKGSTFPSL